MVKQEKNPDLINILGFNYGKTMEIEAVLQLINSKNEISIFEPEDGSDEMGYMYLGYRRKAIISLDSYILWKNGDLYQFQKIIFNDFKDNKRYFDLPKFLKKNDIPYKLMREGVWCGGEKWNQYDFSNQSMVTENGTVFWSGSSWDGWVRNKIGVQYVNLQCSPIIGNKRVTYIEIDDAVVRLDTAEIEKVVEKSYIKQTILSWKEFGILLDEIGLGEEKKKLRVQYRANSGEYEWLGCWYEDKIDWDDDRR